jgi:hypothetical protein
MHLAGAVRHANVAAFQIRCIRFTKTGFFADFAHLPHDKRQFWPTCWTRWYALEFYAQSCAGTGLRQTVDFIHFSPGAQGAQDLLFGGAATPRCLR